MPSPTPIKTDLQVAHDMLLESDKKNLSAVIPKLEAFVSELDAVLATMPPPSPTASVSSFIAKVRANIDGGLTEAKYLLARFGES